MRDRTTCRHAHYSTSWTVGISGKDSQGSKVEDPTARPWSYCGTQLYEDRLAPQATKCYLTFLWEGKGLEGRAIWSSYKVKRPVGIYAFFHRQYQTLSNYILISFHLACSLVSTDLIAWFLLLSYQASAPFSWHFKTLPWMLCSKKLYDQLWLYLPRTLLKV